MDGFRYVTKHILNPGYLIEAVSYDAASTIHLSWMVIATSSNTF